MEPGREEMTRAAAGPAPIPADRFEEGDFVAACNEEPSSLVYFLLNVGDGDTQLILLPSDPEPAHRGRRRPDAKDDDHKRRAIVVDVATNDKLPALVESLADAEPSLLPSRGDRNDEFPIVVGTHPHDDHIGGMPQFLAWFGDHIKEYWDSGYYHPTSAYLETMVHLEEHKKKVTVTQPTSGMTRYIGTVKISAIAPGVGMRSRYDTLGVNINDASIALKLEFPASRIVQRGQNRAYRRPEAPWSLLLGGDAQTTSWAQAAVDFPQLLAEGELRSTLKDQMGPDPLGAEIFKIPHHASKHGVNVELVERVDPELCLVSSVGGAGRYNFPHHLAVEAVREGMQETTSGQQRKPDYDLSLLYTSDRRGVRSKESLGSIAVIVPPRRSRLSVWRFRDEPNEPIDFSKALRFDMR
jgi:glyoxylase-like metal-dependent hydrolase (beta-lactamase superfamily II)